LEWKSLLLVACDIAGVRVTLRCPPGWHEAPLAARFARFPASGAAAKSLTIDLSAGAGTPPPGGFPEYPLRIARAGATLAVSSWYLDGEVDLARGTGRASVGEPDAAGAVENFLRVALAHLLLPDGGFLLHAAAAVAAGDAIVAFGPSGAGKTTISELAGSRPVISDDLVALRRDSGGRLVAVPSPFRAGGAAPHPAGHPVRALLRLKHGDRHALRPLPAAEAAREIVASMPFVNDDAETSSRALELAADAACDPGAAELVFAREPGVWEWLERATRAGDRAAAGGAA
jgi:hypothetical protein